MEVVFQLAVDALSIFIHPEEEEDADGVAERKQDLHSIFALKKKTPTTPKRHAVPLSVICIENASCAYNLPPRARLKSEGEREISKKKRAHTREWSHTDKAI